jgi:hypothetical protein
MIMGLPGLAVAIVAWFTLREPRFEKSHNGVLATPFARADCFALKTMVGAPAPLSLKEVVLTLWSTTTFRHLMFFWSVYGFVGSGLARWWPAFFVRGYGLHTGELGIWFAFIFGLGGTLGPLLGGAWCARYAVNDERLQLRAMAMTGCGLTIVSPFIYLVHDYHVVFGLAALNTVLTISFIGTFWAVVQTVVPKSMCASAAALLMLLGSLIGGGFGPLVTGALSDALRVRFGDESLRYASLALCPGYLWAAWYVWQASKSVTRDVAAVQEGNDRGDHACAAVVLPEIGC